MLLELNSRADITLDLYERVAWRGHAVRFGPSAVQRMMECRNEFLNLIDNDPSVTIYGVTTGYGHHANRRLEGEARRIHARMPPRACVAAFGRPVPDRVARGIVLARLANFIEGHAAVTPALASEVAALLSGGRLPELPLSGTTPSTRVAPFRPRPVSSPPSVSDAARSRSASSSSLLGRDT